jgi:thiol-disulfide isomerase/thioredoxin
MLRRFAFFLILFIAASSFAQVSSDTNFAPLDEWRAALQSGDMTKFADLYSAMPPVEIVAKPVNLTGADTEVTFWNGIRKSGLRDLQVEIFSEKDSPGGKVLSVHVNFKTDTPAGARTRYVLYQQLWQKQGETWHIRKLQHSDVLKMQQPSKLNPHLYDTEVNAQEEIGETVARAAKDHKRIILMFGGNWCYDCHVLDNAFHQPDVAPLIEKYFYVIHVDIGTDGKKNRDVAEKYDTVLDKGVPALAILDSDGKLLMGQQNGEWESARSLDPDDIIAFLNKWKPGAK